MRHQAHRRYGFLSLGKLGLQIVTEELGRMILDAGNAFHVQEIIAICLTKLDLIVNEANEVAVIFFVECL